MPGKSKIIFTSKDEIIIKYLHTPVPEYLSYNSTITIKDNGKNPVSIKLKFDDILPEWAEMPPKEHSINAPTIVELYRKLNRWFRKYGYTFYTH
ncbi:MAG: hypothetical protein SCARUB_02591 [Candidatus Scalindua rubra]|uniref:Uncharacterized protein n=1 Tax=Candidatus Scalindua rubra TaxID=1872076 RepID=A0A1E3X9M9_9BACT|nr:MAG: hypothetical protein SCARUB_02591 [Candidatus Scalindua rubra]